MATLYVNSDWAGCAAGDPVFIGDNMYTYGVDAFSDLQSAVNAASTTEKTTITVFDGTYAGDVYFRTNAGAASGAYYGDGTVVPDQKAEIEIVADGDNAVVTGTIYIGLMEKGTSNVSQWNAAVTLDGLKLDNDTGDNLSIQSASQALTVKDCEFSGDYVYRVTTVGNCNVPQVNFEDCSFDGGYLNLVSGQAISFDGCTMTEVTSNIQGGNGVVFTDCAFTKTVTDDYAADNFYVVRSNDVPITMDGCTINVDSTSSNPAPTASGKAWAVLWERNAGSRKWQVTDTTVNYTSSAAALTGLLFNNNATATAANASSRITIDGIEYNVNGSAADVDDLLDKTAGYLVVTTPTAAYLYNDGDVVASTGGTTLYADGSWAGKAMGEAITLPDSTVVYYGFNAFSSILDAGNAAQPGVATTVHMSGNLDAKANISNGQNITFTGTAALNWKSGWFFVGRGISGADRDAVTYVTFRDATITSINPSTGFSSTGFHVSGYDSTSSSTNYGVLNIIDSTIECDYLLNRNEVNISNSDVTFVNMYTHGRGASESKSGEDETASLNLTNGAHVTVTHNNGMPLGAEGKGLITIDGSTFEHGDASNVFTVSAKGEIQMTGSSSLIAAKGIDNNGTITADGTATLDIPTLTGSGIDIADGAIIKDSTVGGSVNSYINGKVTFVGDNSFGGFSLVNYGSEIIVGEGNTLTVTTNRLTLGYSLNFTVTGSIADALTADKTQELLSLDYQPGFSITGGGTSYFTVEDAYVKLGNTSIKNSAATGTFNLTFTNSIVDFTNQYGLTQTTTGGTAVFNTTFDASVATIASHLKNTDTGSTMILKNGAVLTVNGSFQNYGDFQVLSGATADLKYYTNSSHGGQGGTVTVSGTGSTFKLKTTNSDQWQNSGTVTVDDGGAMNVNYTTNTGNITIAADSLFTGTAINNANGTITIDATDFAGGVRKVIDLDQATALTNVAITGDGAKLLLSDDGDVSVAKVNMAKLYVNAAWTGKALGEEITLPDGETKVYFGVNAFDNVDDIFALYGDKDHRNTETTEVVFLSDTTATATGKQFFYSDVDVAFTAASDVTVDMRSFARAYMMGYYEITNYTGTLSYVPTFTIGENVTMVAKLFMAGQSVDDEDVDAQGDATRDPGAANVIVNGTISAGQTYATAFSNITVSPSGVITTPGSGDAMIIRAQGEIEVLGDGTHTDVQFSPNYISNQGGTLALKDTKVRTGLVAIAESDHDLPYRAAHGAITLDNTVFTGTNNMNISDAQGSLTMINGSQLSISSSITNAGSITIDSSSLLTSTNLTNTGTITIDATNLAAGSLKKVIDLNQATSLSNVVVTGTGARAIYAADGDVYVTNITADKFYVNEAWANRAIGDVVTLADGESTAVYGIEAFSTFSDAYAAAGAHTGTENIYVESDVHADNFGTLSGVNIVNGTADGAPVTIYNTYPSWLYMGYTEIGEGVTLSTGYWFANNSFTVDGSLVYTGQGYHGYGSTVTVTETGYLGAGSEALVIRYNQDSAAGIYVTGNAAAGAAEADRTLQLNVNYFSFYSGTISLTDTLAQSGPMFMNAALDAASYAYEDFLLLDNSIYKISGVLTMTGDATTNLSNQSILSATETITVNSGSTMNVATGSTLRGSGAVTNAGSITIDAASLLVAKSLTNTGTITIDATSLAAGSLKKVIDLNQSTALSDIQLTGTGARLVYGADGDVLVTNISLAKLYVNAAWATGYAVGDEITLADETKVYFGINAFANVDDVFALYGDKDHRNTETTEVVFLSDVTAAATGKQFFYSDVDVAFTAASDVTVDMQTYTRAYMMGYYEIENFVGSPTTVPTFTVGENVTFVAKMLMAGQNIDNPDDVDAQGNPTRDPGAANIVVDGVIRVDQAYSATFSDITITTTGRQEKVSSNDTKARALGTIHVIGDGSKTVAQLAAGYIDMQNGKMYLKDTFMSIGTFWLSDQSAKDAGFTPDRTGQDSEVVADNTLIYATPLNIKYAGGILTLTNGSELSNSGNAIPVTNAGTINITVNSALIGGAVANTGTINIDATSRLTAATIDNSTGAITINAGTGFTGTALVIDITGASGFDATNVTVTGASMFQNAEGDVFITDVAKDTLYVNSAWTGLAGGTQVTLVDGVTTAIVGVNAFANAADALAAKDADTTGIVFESDSTSTAGYSTKLNGLTLSTDVASAEVILSGDASYGMVTGNLTIGENLTLSLDKLLHRAAGTTITVDGTLQTTGTSFLYIGTMEIGETGRLVGADGGSITLNNGTYVINATGTGKANYTDATAQIAADTLRVMTTGTIALEDSYAYANTLEVGSAGTVTLDDSTLSAGSLTLGSELSVTSGSDIKATTLNNNAVLNVAGGSVAATTLNNNSGTANVTSDGTLSIGTLNNSAAVNVTSGAFTATTVANDGAFVADGATLNFGTLTNTTGSVNISGSVISATTINAVRNNAGTFEITDSVLDVGTFYCNNGVTLGGTMTVDIDELWYTTDYYSLKLADGTILNSSHIDGGSVRALGDLTIAGNVTLTDDTHEAWFQHYHEGTITINDGCTFEVAYMGMGHDQIGWMTHTIDGAGLLKTSSAYMQYGEYIINADLESTANFHFTDAEATITGDFYQHDAGGEFLYITNAEVTVQDGGSITTDAGILLGYYYDTPIYGVLTVDGSSSYLDVSSASIEISKLGALEIRNGATAAADSIGNIGTVNVTSGAILTVGEVWNMTEDEYLGSINVAGGELVVTGDVIGESDTAVTVADGTFTVGGTFDNYGKFFVSGYSTVDVEFANEGADDSTLVFDGATITDDLAITGIQDYVYYAGNVTVTDGSNLDIEAADTNYIGGKPVFDADADMYDVTGVATTMNVNADYTITGDTQLGLFGGNAAVNVAADATLTIDGDFTALAMGTVTLASGATLEVAGDVTNYGAFALDYASQFIATSYDNGSIGTLTVDASGFTTGTYKVVDLNQATSLAGAVTVTGLTTGSVFYGADGDVVITDADASKLYVNAAWVGKTYGDVVEISSGVSAVYGINAFDTMGEAAGHILTDGSDTTVNILSNLTPASTIEFTYGDGDVSFVSYDGTPYSVAFANTGDFVFQNGTDASIVIGENVTFSTYNNQSDFAVFYGPSLEVYGTVSGGANFGALYLYDGDHTVHTTGTVATGRIHNRMDTLTIKGVEGEGDAQTRRYAADVAVADRDSDAQVDVNFIFHASGIFNASDTYITVGDLATGGDGHGVYDTNKGGVQDQGTASIFNLTNTKLETYRIALSKDTTAFNAAGSVIEVTGPFANAGEFNLSGAELTIDGTAANTGVIDITGASTLTTANSITGNGKIEIHDATLSGDFATANKIVTYGTTTIGGDVLSTNSYDQGYTTHTASATPSVTTITGDFTAKNYYIGNDTADPWSGSTFNATDKLVVDSGAHLGTPAVQDNTQIYLRGTGEIEAKSGAVIGNESGNIVNLMDYGKMTLTGATAYLDGFVVYGVDINDDPTTLGKAEFNASGATIDVAASFAAGHGTPYTVGDLSTRALVGGKSGKGAGTVNLADGTEMTVATNLAVGFVSDGTVNVDASTLTVDGTLGVGLSTGTGTVNVTAAGEVEAGTLTIGANGVFDVAGASAVTVTSDVTNAGAFAMDYTSTLTAASYTQSGTGSITIDATGYTAGTYKVVDLSQATSLEGVVTVSGLTTGNVIYGDDGDVVITDVIPSKVTYYVNADWATGKSFGDVVTLLDGGTAIYGVNAYGSFATAIESIVSETTTVQLESSITENVLAPVAYFDHEVAVIKAADLTGVAAVTLNVTGNSSAAPDTDGKMYLLKDTATEAAKLTISEGVSLTVPHFSGDYGSALYFGYNTGNGMTVEIDGEVNAYVFYNAFGTDLTVTSTGKITSTEQFTIRRTATVTIDGGNNFTEAAPQGEFAYTSQQGGIVNLKDTVVDGGAWWEMWNRNSVDPTGVVLNMDNATLVTDRFKGDGANKPDQGFFVNLTNGSTLKVSGDISNVGTFTATGSTVTGASLTQNKNVNATFAAVDSTVTISGAVTNEAGITVTRSTLYAGGAFANAGAVVMDYQSTIGFATMTNTGTITIDATGYTGGKFLLLDSLNNDYTEAQYRTLLGASYDEDNFRVENGDLYYLNYSASEVYVNSTYSATGDNDGHTWGVDAFASFADATAINPAKITATSGGSYTGTTTFEGAVGDIEGGTFGGSVAAGVYVNTDSRNWVDNEEDLSLTIADGTFSKTVVGGDFVDKGYCGRFGDISLTIEGGTFSSTVGGGMAYTPASNRGAAEVYGNVSLTITGGTFNRRIYGGNICRNGYGSRTLVDGNVTLTVDASANAIAISENIVAGSFDDGNITGNTSVVFKGDGANLTFTGMVIGGSGSTYFTTDSETRKHTYVSYVDGSRSISFSGFSGDFGGDFRAFTDITFADESEVSFSNAELNATDIENWNIGYGSSVAGIVANNFADDTLNIDVTGWDTSSVASWDAMTGAESAFTGWDAFSSVSIGGEAASFDGSKWASSSYELSLEDADENKKFVISLKA